MGSATGRHGRRTQLHHEHSQTGPELLLAAAQLERTLTAARRLRLTGIGLKDDSRLLKEGR